MIDKKNVFLKSVSILWVFTLLGAMLSFITQAAAGRLLGTYQYGLFSSALAIATIGSPLAAFGIQGFWLKIFGQEGIDGVRWIKSSLIFAFLSTTITIMIILLWAIAGEHELAFKYCLIIISFHVVGIGVVEIITTRFMLEGNSIKVSLWQFWPHFFRFLCVIFALLVLQAQRASDVAWAYFVASILLALIGARSIVGLFSGKIDISSSYRVGVTDVDRARSPTLVKTFDQAWPFGVSNFFHLVYFQSGVIFVAMYAGAQEAGLYNAAFVLLAAIYLLPSVFYQKYMLPKVHRWAYSDTAAFHSAFHLGNKYMLILGVLGFVVVYFLSYFLVKLLFGVEFLKSSEILKYLAVCIPIRFLSTSVGSVLVTKNNMQIKVYIMFFVALLNVSLNALLGWRIGSMGVVFATIASEILLLIAYLIFARKVFREHNNFTLS